MTRQLACAFGVFLSTSVAAQCKADFVSTDKAADVRAALACWKDRYETKASELDKTIAKL